MLTNQHNPVFIIILYIVLLHISFTKDTADVVWPMCNEWVGCLKCWRYSPGSTDTILFPFKTDNRSSQKDNNRYQ